VFSLFFWLKLCSHVMRKLLIIRVVRRFCQFIGVLFSAQLKVVF